MTESQRQQIINQMLQDIKDIRERLAEVRGR